MHKLWISSSPSVYLTLTEAQWRVGRQQDDSCISDESTLGNHRARRGRLESLALSVCIICGQQWVVLRAQIIHSSSLNRSSRHKSVASTPLYSPAPRGSIKHRPSYTYSAWEWVSEWLPARYDKYTWRTWPLCTCTGTAAAAVAARSLQLLMLTSTCIVDFIPL